MGIGFGAPWASRRQKRPLHFYGEILRRHRSVAIAWHSSTMNQAATKISVADLRLDVAAGGREPNIPLVVRTAVVAAHGKKSRELGGSKMEL